MAGEPLTPAPTPPGPVDPNKDGRAVTSAANGRLSQRPPRPKAGPEPDAPSLPLVHREQFESVVEACDAFVLSGKKIKWTAVSRHTGLSYQVCQQVWHWVSYCRKKGMNHMPAMGLLYETVKDAASTLVKQGLETLDRANVELEKKAADAKAQADASVQAAAKHAAEAEAARIAAAELERQAREAAQLAQKQEAQLAALTRTVGLVQLANVQKLARTLPELGNALETRMNALAKDQGASVHQLMDVMERFSKLTEKAANLAELALEIQRISVGAPTEVIKHVTEVQAPVLDRDQALAEIEAANRAAERAKQQAAPGLALVVNNKPAAK